MAGSGTADGGGFTPPDISGLSVETRAIVAVLAIILIYWLVQRLLMGGAGSRRSSILFVGPSGVGKTVLYLQLKEGDTLNGTVTSMDENEGTFRPNTEGADSIDRAVHFVDLPGHPRLKHKLDKYIGGAAGIIFMLDATDFMPHSKDIAEQLYDLLTHPVFRNNRLPLMLACNKADQGAKAHTDTFIVKLLEKEIENLRSTQSTLEGEGQRADVGKVGETFSFSHVASKVSVAKVSAITGDIGPVLQFTRDCLKL